MITTTELIKHLRTPKERLSDGCLLDEAANLLEFQALQLEKMKGFIEFYATCPCCCKDDECLDDCTFFKDAPQSFDVMKMAREALK
jgi:hypothetical protein